MAAAGPQPIEWASPEQRELFLAGPSPVCASGGFGSAKTYACCLKALRLSDAYPGNRGLIYRQVGIDLHKTTMTTLAKILPRDRCAEWSDQKGRIVLKNGSEILFMHMDNPDIENVIKGLEINWFFGDQAEDTAEEVFDKLRARLGRWDKATVPDWMLRRDEAVGREWAWRNPVTGRPIPPTYAMIAVNPDSEVHWVYNRFHPESSEWQEKWQHLGYRMICFSTRHNKFLPKQNLDELLAHDPEFVRRYVDGLWGIPEGVIHTIPPESIIEFGDALEAERFIERLRQTCTLGRTLDHGDSAPTVCAWWAVDRNGNVFCVSPEMRVLTEDLRYVPAGSVTAGDRLQAFDETAAPGMARHHRVATVESVERVTKPGCRVTMSDGTVLVCSEDHLWLTQYTSGSNHRWRRTDSLSAMGGKRLRIRSGTLNRRGDRIVKMFPVWDELATYESGYLAGLLDGEGTVSTKELSFGQNVGPVLEKALEILKSLSVPYSRQDYTAESGAQFANVRIHGRSNIARVLGSVRPRRLLSKAKMAGQMYVSGGGPTVVSVEHIGPIEVVAIQTTTGTFIVEGFASHNCYREYYQPNKLVSYHREQIAALSAGESYTSNLADPSIFAKGTGGQKHGQFWSVADEYAERRELPAETAVTWFPADNNEMGTRNRIGEYLRVDPERVHPATGAKGAPHLFFVKRNEHYPGGCVNIIRETRAQKRKCLGTVGGKKTFSDERDPAIVDHGYDCLRYTLASRPPIAREAARKLDPRTFAGQQRRLKRGPQHVRI